MPYLGKAWFAILASEANWSDALRLPCQELQLQTVRSSPQLPEPQLARLLCPHPRSRPRPLLAAKPLVVAAAPVVPVAADAATAALAMLDPARNPTAIAPATVPTFVAIMTLSSDAPASLAMPPA